MQRLAAVCMEDLQTLVKYLKAVNKPDLTNFYFKGKHIVSGLLWPFYSLPTLDEYLASDKLVSLL